MALASAPLIPLISDRDKRSRATHFLPTRRQCATTAKKPASPNSDLFSVDALHEIRHVGDGPVWILCLELGGKRPASLSTATPCFFRPRARVRRSTMNAFSLATSEPSPTAL